jgi:hypothetical protein
VLGYYNQMSMRYCKSVNNQPYSWRSKHFHHSPRNSLRLNHNMRGEVIGNVTKMINMGTRNYQEFTGSSLTKCEKC